MNIKYKKIKKLKDEENKLKEEIINSRVIVNFRDSEGNEINSKIDLSIDTNINQLKEVLNDLLKNEDEMNYSFFYKNYEIRNNLKEFIYELDKSEFSTEKVFTIDYHPETIFNVRPITRISTSLSGHEEAVLDVSFSPNGEHLASGSGDNSVRFWDLHTETPYKKCEGHIGWVQIISFSPNSEKLATGDSNGLIIIWNSKTKKQHCKLKGHKKYISSITWQPYHLNENCDKLVSSSKDFTIRIWNSNLGNCLRTINMHSMCVTKVLWSGTNKIYSSSQDRTIKIFDKNGQYINTLQGHAHWINCMSLNTSFVLRTGYVSALFNEKEKKLSNKDKAIKRHNDIYLKNSEIIASGSEDCTIILWKPEKELKPFKRLTGHQGIINHLQYSPDGKFIVSASFDKSIKLWNGINGDNLGTFRGHIAPVYMISWSLDSKIFLSGSKDTTLKVWYTKTKKLAFDLPGHADEVYSIDWSPDGEKVASGGKDRMLRIWKN